MRPTMRKEITSSTIKFGKVDLANMTITDVTEVTVIGNLSQGTKAIDYVTENHGKGFSILSLETTTQVYVAEVADFLKIAKLHTPTENDSNESDSND